MKVVKNIITILSVLIYFTQCHQHTHDGKNHECVHDKMQAKADEKWNQVMKKIREKEKIASEQNQLNSEVSDEGLKIKKQSRRKLASYAVPVDGNTSPIRIKFYTDFLDEYSDTVLTPQQKTFLLDQLEAAKTFYEQRLKVIPYSQANLIITNDSCSGDNKTVPADHKSTGVGSDVDFYVYVTVENSPTQGFLAYANKCQQEMYDSPDFNPARPVAALLNFNTAYLTEFDDAAFAQVMDTTLHELAHAMAFSSSLFPYFRKSDGSTYGLDVYQQDVDVRGYSTNILKTPNVRAWAANQFGCQRINDDSETEDVFKGMQLENQGGSGSAGSHWERTMVYDELMTASRLGPSKTFSGATFALFKDSGFYFVDNSNEETLQWGFQKGCDFYKYGCQDPNNTYEEFCNFEGQTQCSGGREGKGGCTLQNLDAYFMDGCGIVVPYGNAKCINQSDRDFDYGYQANYQYYGYSDSRCFESTLGGGGSSKCYQYECNSTPEIIITLNGTQYTCTEKGQEFFNEEGLSGIFKCPDPFTFCSQSRKYCPNWCSSKGYCTDGICNCREGYGGPDCSKTEVQSGCNYTTEFLDYATPDASPTCKTSAGCIADSTNTKYPNLFNRVCESCSELCDTCNRGGPDKCLTCQGSLVLFIVDGAEGKCFSECPWQYYDNAGTCNSCDSLGLTGSESCLTCDSNGCLSCQGSDYLDQTGAENKCITLVTDCNQANGMGTFKINDYYDVRECLTACPNTMVVDPDDANRCKRCSDTQFMDLNSGPSCVGTCPTQYFGNTETRVCDACDGICDECFGPTSKHCLGCTNQYYFAGRCFSEKEKCPPGSYGNETTKICDPCNENCLQCTGPSNTECSACVSGSYYDPANSKCFTDCNDLGDGFYEDKIYRRCEQCDSSCKNCKKEKDIHCTECEPPKVLLINGSEQTCEDACPTSQIIDTTLNQCVNCHSTCKTCNGLTSISCLLCKENYFKYTFTQIDTENNTETQITTCIFKCPNGFYSVGDGETDGTEAVCQPCHQNCLKCTGVLETECLKCYNSDGSSLPFLDNNTCVNKCPENKPLDEFSGECFGEIRKFIILLLIVIFTFTFI